MREDGKILYVIPDLCSGCRNCEVWCSFLHNKKFAFSKGQIKIQKVGEFDVPIISCYGKCVLDNPFCVEVCPTGALIYETQSKISEKIIELYKNRAKHPIFKLIAPWKWPYPWRNIEFEG